MIQKIKISLTVITTNYILFNDEQNPVD